MTEEELIQLGWEDGLAGKFKKFPKNKFYEIGYKDALEYLLFRDERLIDSKIELEAVYCD